MTQSDYKKEGYDKQLCSFTFMDGKTVFGEISDFFPNDPNYYLVPMSNMAEFQRYLKENDHAKMKNLCSIVNLDDLKQARRLDTFGEMLVTKVLEAEGNKAKLESRKATWLKSIDDLYSKINLWFEDFKKDGLIEIKDQEIYIDEESIGKYRTKRLEIYIGNDVITLTPKGTFIIGSFGRIDLSGPKGDALLVEPEWNEWKFAKRTPKIIYSSVTEQSLKQVIQEIING